MKGKLLNIELFICRALSFYNLILFYIVISRGFQIHRILSGSILLTVNIFLLLIIKFGETACKPNSVNAMGRAVKVSDLNDCRTKDELEAAAVHEAGHYVMAQYHNFKITAASIEMNAATRSGGHVKYQLPEVTGEKEYRQIIMIDYAGEIAEEIILGRKNFMGASKDISAATISIGSILQLRYRWLNLDLAIGEPAYLELCNQLSMEIAGETRKILEDMRKEIIIMKEKLLEQYELTRKEKDKNGKSAANED